MKEFMGVILEEIKGYVKENGRRISDNSIKMDLLSDDVKEVKKDIRDMGEVIAEMKEDVNTLIELNNEQRKTNQDIRVLLDQVMTLTSNMRKDMDEWKSRDEVSYRKVGAM